MWMVLTAFTGLSIAPNWAAANPFGPDYVEIQPQAGIVLDIRYATVHNFTGQNVYQGRNTCFLHRLAADKLLKAAEILQKNHPGTRLLIFDCLRPRSVQRLFWGLVKGTPQQKYVGNPDVGSIHNFGFAVDLSLLGPDGRELDMGTPYDAFTDAAQPRLEPKMAARGLLTRDQLDRRLMLRRVMAEAGFIQLPHEWWHYDGLPGKTVRKNYPIVE